MDVLMVIAIVFIMSTAGFFYFAGRKNSNSHIIPGNVGQLLTDNVVFYNKLNDNDKQLFEARVRHFLDTVAVRGVEVNVEELDRVLVAAGAIIPIFNFPDWKYNNISEVLLYKGTFSRDFDTDGASRNVLGMVGDGPMHREMILSLPSVRSSFQNARDGQNTVIHEFVHLLDKADGATDGIPEYLLVQPQIIPWVKRMHETINRMRVSGKSDIDLYGATGDSEFFAVVAEYFFEKPDQLKQKHPDLYALLEEMFVPAVSQ